MHIQPINVSAYCAFQYSKGIQKIAVMQCLVLTGIRSECLKCYSKSVTKCSEQETRTIASIGHYMEWALSDKPKRATSGI